MLFSRMHTFSLIIIIGAIFLCLPKKGDGSDRRDHICSIDLGEKEVSDSWYDALELLGKNYANEMVIRALPEVLHYKVVILTVYGVGKQFLSKGRQLDFYFI